MTKTRLRLVALAAAVFVLIGTVSASALTLPDLFPDRPPEVPAEVPWPTEPPAPPVNDPDPEAILAVIVAQIEAIAAQLGTTPEAILGEVMGTQPPDAEAVVMTIEDLIERLTGTQVPDETSHGLAGLPEIAIGNISHNYDVTRLVPAGTAPVNKCAPGIKTCTTTANGLLPSPNLNHPSFAQYRYSEVKSQWLPSAPAASVLGTSLLLPIVTAQLPAPVPPEAAPLLALFKPNFILASEPGGLLTSIQGGGWTNVAADGSVVEAGRHNGGTGLANGSNVDTAQRNDPTAFDPTSVDPNNPATIVDLIPIYVPLLTSSNPLVNTLPDSAIDFVGFGNVRPPSILTPLTSCSNTGTGATPNVSSTAPDGTQMVTWGAQNCRLRQSMSGFGIAIYNDSPLNFRTDLAPLWGPTPPGVDEVNAVVASLVAALTPLVPSQSALITYALQVLAYAMATAPDAPEGGEGCLPLPAPIPCIPLPTGELPTGELPPLPTGELPPLPTGEVPALPVPLPTP